MRDRPTKMREKTRNTARRYAINAASSVATTLISMTVLVWVNQYLLRRISPAEYALVPVLFSLMVFAEFFRIIFTRGLSRFMVEADARGDDTEVTRIVSSMLPVLALVALVLAVAGAVAIRHIDSLILVDPAFIGSARVMLALLVVTLCVSIVTTPICAGLYVRMRFVELNLIELGTELIRMAVLLALMLGLGPRAVWVVVASSVANLGNFTTLAIISYRILPSARFRGELVSLATARRLLSFSLWTSVQGLNLFVQRAAPALLLNRFSNEVNVAAFYVGNLPNQQMRKLIQAAAGPATPALTALYATEGEAALQEFYYRGGRYHLWAALFLTPPLIIYAEPLIRLYVGGSYIEAAMVMLLLLASYPFNWASAMFYQIAYATGRIRAYNICSIALAITAMAGMYYLVAVRDMGAIGAAWGMAGGFGLAQLVIIWPFGLRLVHGSWRRFLRSTLLPGMAPFLAALLACWLFELVLPVDSWLRFFMGCGISALVYLGVLLGLCLDLSERQTMHQMLRRITQRTK